MTTTATQTFVEGPAWLFCNATTHWGTQCKAGLRPDGTCPAERQHDPRPEREYRPYRMEAPALIYQMPLCPLCEESTYHDGDAFRCDGCGFSWSSQGNEPGTADDEHERQCDATDGEHRCVLTEGHTGPKRRRYVWTGRRFEWQTVREPNRHRGVRVERDGYPDRFGYFPDEVGHSWDA